MSLHRGFHDRGKLPHRDVPGSNVAVTFRLADSLPATVVDGWKLELAAALDSQDERLREEALAELRERIASYEDAGHGECFLGRPEIAEIVRSRLLASAPEECELHAWCVMPNHVHVLLRITDLPLGDLLRRWKGATAREINSLLGRSGTLWQREYFDRGIRDEEHFRRAQNYIERNPVLAGLCSKPTDWPFSSAAQAGVLNPSSALGVPIGAPDLSGTAKPGPRGCPLPDKSGAPLAAARLYGILDLGYTDAARLEETTHALIAGGADLLQLRAKQCSPDQILAFGRRIHPICQQAGVPFIVNDYPEIAAELGADGLHLGQDDGLYSEVRKFVGDEMILGRSTHSPDQARQALLDGFDYIGFGPLFPTPTKRGRPGIGMQHVREIESEVGSRIPVFCIGGIRRDNLSKVTAAGARRVVIVSDLLTSPDIESAVHEALQILGGK